MQVQNGLPPQSGPTQVALQDGGEGDDYEAKTRPSSHPRRGDVIGPLGQTHT